MKIRQKKIYTTLPSMAIVWVLFQPLSLSSQAQNGSSCLAELKTCNRQMNESIVKHRDAGVSMHYSIQVAIKGQSPDKAKVTEVSLYAKGDHAFFHHDDIEVFQDEKTSVRVLPHKKEIRIYDYRDQGSKQYVLDRYKLLNDSLFQTARVINCEIMNSGENSVKKVRLQIDEKWTRTLHVAFANVTYDTQMERLREFELFYTPESKYSYMKVIIKEIAYGEDADIPPGNALSMIFKNNQLRPRYSGYQVADHRTSNTTQK